MITAAALVPALFLGLIFTIVLISGSGQSASASDCTPAGSSDIDLANLPTGSVAGYSGEQLMNAALIVNAGKAAGLNVKGQTIGVMTAMGESSLRVLDRGDAAGPDSRGLFQQRDNGAWGSYEDRMDPTISATNFSEALQDVEGFESLAPTEAAHQVQHNADPYHYEQYWSDAVTVVAAVAGIDGLQTCLSNGPTLVGEGDDLPWPNSEIYTASPLGMYNRECVDFVLWRLNKMAGVTSAPWQFHNSELGLGNAENWINVWHREGWEVGQTPKVGAVAYYRPGVGGAGGYGHVAIVSDVAEDGTVTVEEYNGQPAPNDHQYGIRESPPEETSAYLYFPG